MAFYMYAAPEASSRNNWSRTVDKAWGWLLCAPDCIFLKGRGFIIFYKMGSSRNTLTMKEKRLLSQHTLIKVHLEHRLAYLGMPKVVWGCFLYVLWIWAVDIIYYYGTNHIVAFALIDTYTQAHTGSCWLARVASVHNYWQVWCAHWVERMRELELHSMCVTAQFSLPPGPALCNGKIKSRAPTQKTPTPLYLSFSLSISLSRPYTIFPCVPPPTLMINRLQMIHEFKNLDESCADLFLGQLQ